MLSKLFDKLQNACYNYNIRTNNKEGKKMENIIKERIAILQERYERRLKNYKTEHITPSAKEFFKRQAENTKEQIELLQSILATKELENY